MREIQLSNGLFQTRIVPESGGNVISFRALSGNVRLLREPDNPEELKAFPEQFGIPVLFPPNRIADGCFVFEGKHYRLPVNETAHRNHLHGLVVGKPWRVLSADETSAELLFSFTPDSPEYSGFPFSFSLTRKVRLTEFGLIDEMEVFNQGQSDMPLGLGYHTTFPAINAQIRLCTGAQQFEIGERFLPTGRMVGWQDFDPRFFFNPNGINVGFHAQAETGALKDAPDFHGAEIRYPEGVLRYATDRKFGFWYTWNKRGKGDFISIEPVSWMADALNQRLPPSATGVRVLRQNERISFCNELQFLR